MLKAFLATVAIAWLVNAQPRRPSPVSSLTRLDGTLARDLNLTETQSQQIEATLSQYRGKLAELREAVNKAESGLEAVFNEDTVDQRKANDAIERLVAARAELFRTTSQLDLKVRMLFTAEQWQDLKNRQHGRGGMRRRGPGPVSKGPPPGSPPSQPAKTAPSISSQK